MRHVCCTICDTFTACTFRSRQNPTQRFDRATQQEPRWNTRRNKIRWSDSSGRVWLLPEQNDGSGNGPACHQGYGQLVDVALFSSTLLFFGFFMLIRYHVISLRFATNDINERLGRWGETIDDSRIIRLGEWVGVIAFLVASALLLTTIGTAALAYKMPIVPRSQQTASQNSQPEP